MGDATVPYVNLGNGGNATCDKDSSNQENKALVVYRDDRNDAIPKEKLCVKALTAFRPKNRPQGRSKKGNFKKMVGYL